MKITHNFSPSQTRGRISKKYHCLGFYGHSCLSLWVRIGEVRSLNRKWPLLSAKWRYLNRKCRHLNRKWRHFNRNYYINPICILHGPFCLQMQAFWPPKFLVASFLHACWQGAASETKRSIWNLFLLSTPDWVLYCQDEFHGNHMKNEGSRPLWIFR